MCVCTWHMQKAPAQSSECAPFGVSALLLVCHAEAAEHDLVIKQLEPMDKARKCYRLIGDVMVERTVAETLPAGVVLTGKSLPLVTLLPRGLRHRN